MPNYNVYVDALKKQGYGEEDANMKALWELYGRAPLEAGFSGFVMGALSGAMVNTSNVFEAGKYADAEKIGEYLKGELNQNYMGETGKAAASLRADAIKGLKTAGITQNPVRAAWNMGRAATGAAELADMPKLIINSDTVFSDLRNEERNGAAQNKNNKWTSERITQLDNAVKKSGVNIIIEDIFRGGTEEMNGFLARNYTAAREITDTMKNIIDSVKIRFGVEPSSVYGRAVRSFEKALAKRETGGESGIQFSTADNSAEGKSVKQQLEENADKLNSMEPVFVRNDISAQRGNRGDNLNWILKELGTKDIRVQREGVGEIILDSKRISNSLRYLKSDGELAAYAALPNVLKKGIIIYNNPNHKNRNYSTYTIGARVVINDTPGNMGVVIRFDKGKNYYKIHRILMPDGSSFVYKNNESSAERAVPNAENALGRTPAVTAFNNSILENGEKYNSNFNQNNKGRLSELHSLTTR